MQPVSRLYFSACKIRQGDTKLHSDVRKCRKTSSRSVKKIGNVNIDPYSQSDQHGNLITSIGSPLAHVYELSLVDIHQHVRELSCGHRHTPTGVIQGGTGGRSPQNFGWGDDIAHIPPPQ